MVDVLHASAPGKLMLLGEYAVLHEAPALVGAVDRRVHVRWHRGEHSQVTVSAPTLGLREAQVIRRHGSWSAHSPQHAQLLALACSMLDAFAQSAELVAGHFHIDSTDLYQGAHKLGLGSSAAVAVALGGLLARLTGKPVQGDALWSVVHAAHRRAQGGKGSGADVAASLAGGVVSYRRDQMPRPVDFPKHVAITVVWTGESASTPQLVQRVQDAARREGPTSRVLASMASLAESGARAAAAGDTATLLNVMDAYGRAYGELGEASGVDLLTPAHGRLLEIVTEAGGVYKPSGAGGGDVGLAFAPAPVEQPVRQAIAAAGYEILPLHIGAPGLRFDDDG